MTTTPPTDNIALARRTLVPSLVSLINDDIPLTAQHIIDLAVPFGDDLTFTNRFSARNTLLSWIPDNSEYFLNESEALKAAKAIYEKCPQAIQIANKNRETALQVSIEAQNEPLATFFLEKFIEQGIAHTAVNRLMGIDRQTTLDFAIATKIFSDIFIARLKECGAKTYEQLVEGKA